MCKIEQLIFYVIYIFDDQKIIFCLLVWLLIIIINIENRRKSMKLEKSLKSSMLTQKISGLNFQQNELKRVASQQEHPWSVIKSSSASIKGRYHHSSVLVQGKLYVFGGFDNDTGVLSDFKARVWKPLNQDCLNQNLISWEQLTIQKGPGPRHSHSSVAYNGIIYIFGGKVDRFNSTNSFYGYSIEEKKWFEIDNNQEQDQASSIEGKTGCYFKPPPIDSHQAVVIGKQMVIYGGFSNNQFTNDIYSFDFESKTWKWVYNSRDKDLKSEAMPEPRADFSLVHYDKKLYIFGGKNLSQNYSDFWSFDMQKMQFNRIQPNIDLQRRSGHSAVVYEDKMILFGGITAITHQRDDLICYSFSQKQWSVIWKNTEVQVHKKQNNQEKTSSSRNKVLDITHFNTNQEKSSKMQKYRRPIAEQKCQNARDGKRSNFQRVKKQNEKKMLILDQIQKSSKHESIEVERLSPLIQSLTNSIMLTSNQGRGSACIKQSNAQKNSAHSKIDPPQISSYKPKRLQARDGHTTHISEKEMIIFGGDRHMISLNDILCINLQHIFQRKQKQKK